MILVDNKDIKVTPRWERTATNLKEQMKNLNEAQRQSLINANQRLWRNSNLKKELKKASHYKCWYCEREVTGFFGHVDHYRPKNNVKNKVGPDESGYWWLAFELSNYRIACDLCNTYKSDNFPLLPGSTRGTSQTGINFEKTVLLDPVNIEDTELVWFQDNGILIARDGISETDTLRVQETITILHLNHDEHLKSRIKLLRDCEELRIDLTIIYNKWKKK